VRRCGPKLALASVAAVALSAAPCARAQETPVPPTPTAVPPGAVAPAAPTPTAVAPPVGAGIEGDRRHVSLNLRGVPLADVLRTLGDLYELNLILPKDVSGTVTLVVKDVPVEEALEAICAQHDLALVKTGSILRVVPRAQVPISASERAIRDSAAAGSTDTAIPLIVNSEIKLFDIRFARGEDLVNLVQPLITPKIGYVAYNAQTQKLVVRDLPQNMEKIAEVITKIDVAPQEDAAKGTAQLPAAIKIVRLRYVETAALRKVLEKISKAENVDVEEEATTKSLVLRGFPERIAAVERMIQTLDQKTQQVRIRVRLVETTLGNDEKLGINWNMRLRASGSARPWSFPFPSHTPTSWVFYPTPNPTSTVGSGIGGATGATQLAGFGPGDSMPEVLSNQFTFGILDASQASAVLDAIASDAKTNLLASPQLTTLDNHHAKITLGSILPVPIFTNVLNQQTGTVFPTITGFSDVETGTILNVTPRIGADEYVSLDVAPEISEITGFVGSSQERPIRSQRRMETSVVLQSGSTLVLGGLNQTKTVETVNKIPVLGDIPVVGRLFSWKETTLDKTDLIIFITPEIVKDQSEVVEKPAEREGRERGLVKVGERWVAASLVDAVNRVGQRLESPQAQQRRDAVVEVAGMADAERSELLKRADVLASVLKRDTDVDVKRAAAESLGAVDPARLATELSSLPGATPLQAIGEVLVPMALRTPSRSVRELILANAIRVDRASTVTALMAAVAFGKPYERLAGAEGLALAGDPAAITVLDEAAREAMPSPSGRPPSPGAAALAPAAIDAIGASGGPRAVVALLDELAQKPGPHLELHIAAALAEAIGDDQRMTKELAARGLVLSRRTQELLIRERRERRARFDRVLKAYAAVEGTDAPEVTGPTEAVRKVRDALELLAAASPGHRHLVAVALRGIDVAAPPVARPGAVPAPGAALPPPPVSSRAPERVEAGRLKLSAADVEATPAIHLAHDLVYHAALADALAPPADVKPGVPVAPAVLGPIGHRVEEDALREQWLAIQALAGRSEFRDVDGAAAAIEEALQARDLGTAPRAERR
jgi:type II secretory pathway component GspD/PulD (secretin)